MAKQVFISHHSESSGELTRKIAEILESKGVTCWYAPRDIKAGEDYPSAITKAIRGCRVFLLILNENAQNSEHVLNELDIAFEGLKNKSDYIILPFKVKACELSDSLSYYLRRIHIMNGTIPTEGERINELVERIIMHLGANEGISAEADDGAGSRRQVYTLNSSLLYPDSSFVGRGEEIAQIHARLKDVENILFLVGMGGIGKSEIAKTYAYRYKNEYKVICWVTFNESIEKTVINDYAFPVYGLSRKDYPNDSDREYYERKMNILKQIADRDVLFVFDNFDCVSDENLDDFCSGEYSILFTTRYHRAENRYPHLVIREMTDKEELLQLFKTEYFREITEESKDSLYKIFDLLNNHTLSIRLVASTMQKRRISPESMLGLLKNGLWQMRDKNLKGYEMIHERINQLYKLATLSDDEKYIMENLSLIPLEGIKVEEFYEWCEIDDFDVIEELIARSWIIHNVFTDEVHLHPLVAELMHAHVRREPENCNTLVGHICAFLGISSRQSFVRKMQLFHIINYAYNVLPDDYPLKYSLLKTYAKLCTDVCLYDEALSKYETIIKEMKQKELSVYEQIEVYRHYSQTFTRGCRHAEGKQAALEGLKLFENLDLENLDRITGNYYLELNKRICEADSAVGDFESSINRLKGLLPYASRYYYSTPEESEGWILVHLINALVPAGRLGEAVECCKRALSLAKQCGNGYLELFVNENYAYTLGAEKKLDEAVVYIDKAYSALCKYCGAEHTDTGYCLELKGNIYRDNGRFADAAYWYEQSKQIFDRLPDKKQYNKLQSRADECKKLAAEQQNK